MKKIDLPLILDVLFYTACAWFLSIGVLRYYRLPLALSVSVCSIIALAAGGAAFLLIYSKHRRRALTKAEQNRKEKLMLHLTLERPNRVLESLAAAYRADGKDAAMQEDAVLLEEKLLVPLFTMQPLSADAVATLLRRHGEQPFALACNALTPEAEKLLASFGRSAVRGDEIFALFERTKSVPEKLICGDIPRPKLKAKLIRTFSKKNARPFFVSGILLLIMSLITFFPLYYLISGSVLILCAICVRFLGYA
ncbi:MAG: hypothetical protein IKD43_04960 [Clostridia bacterium]|nr:hypothetical protein [Clostridia bacterium]